MYRVRLIVALTAIALAPTIPLAQQQERLDHETYARIRAEALERSQIMHTLHMLTDVYGPRLTGSPSLKAASEWVVTQSAEWGLKNARLEPWDWRHPGWANERTSVFLTAPVKDSLVVETLAWTPGTNGTVTASAVLIDPPSRVTREQLTAYFDANRARVKGRIVLVGEAATVPVVINPPPKRRDDAQVQAQFDPKNPQQAGPFGPPPPQGPQAPDKNLLPASTVNEEFGLFLKSAGALVRINDAGREHGQIRAFSNSTYDVTKVVPTVVMRNEDYGRIARLLARQMDVQLEINIVNHVYPEGRTQYNVIAEIPGIDKAHEVVMLG
jgi:carboxypeptidase Q